MRYLPITLTAISAVGVGGCTQNVFLSSTKSYVAIPGITENPPQTVLCLTILKEVLPMLKVDLMGVHLAGTAKTIAADMVELLRAIAEHADEIGEEEAARITLTVRDFAELSLQGFPYYQRNRDKIELASNEASLSLAAEMLEWVNGSAKNQTETKPKTNDNQTETK